MKRILAICLSIVVTVGIANAQNLAPRQDYTSDCSKPIQNRNLTFMQATSQDVGWQLLQGTTPKNVTNALVTFQYAPPDRSWRVDATGAVENATNGTVLIRFTPTQLNTNSGDSSFDFQLQVYNATQTLVQVKGQLTLLENINSTAGPLVTNGILYMSKSIYDPAGTNQQVVGISDSRLSDARTPTAHNQAWSTITSTPTSLSGYGITDTVVCVESDPVAATNVPVLIAAGTTDATNKAAIDAATKYIPLGTKIAASTNADYAAVSGVSSQVVAGVTSAIVNEATNLAAGAAAALYQPIVAGTIVTNGQPLSTEVVLYPVRTTNTTITTNLVVTGTLTPDVTGSYTNRAANEWQRSDAWEILYDGGVSYTIQKVPLTPFWIGGNYNTKNPVANYSPFGGATGTAAVAYSLVTNTTVTTNWIPLGSAVTNNTDDFLPSSTAIPSTNNFTSIVYSNATAFATAAQGVKADDAMPKAGGTMTGALVQNGAGQASWTPYVVPFAASNVISLANGDLQSINLFGQGECTVYLPNSGTNQFHSLTLQINPSTNTLTIATNGLVTVTLATNPVFNLPASTWTTCQFWKQYDTNYWKGASLQ